MINEKDNDDSHSMEDSSFKRPALSANKEDEAGPIEWVEANTLYLCI